ncbi:MAG: oxidoreductase [Pelagibacterales bacterium]|nr:oxidoreductase [Pelagibacterales bacterium]|tara:strand:- start:647 stop:1492 length:846 start_codon:yes stop_codon:yes gene_type:complete
MSKIDISRRFNNFNKWGLITGACGLLGQKHALALLETGASVVLTDIDEKLLIKTKLLLESDKYPGKIINCVMDVSSESSINYVSKLLQSKNIRIDILINNAALNPKQSSLKNNIRTTRLENFSLDRWNLEISVGLTGAYLCSKIFGSAMAEDNKGGVILNIASDLSIIAPDQRIYRQDGLANEMQAVKPVTYSVIKAGLIGLTRYLATYWPENGVRANALSPGGVYTNQDSEFVKRLTNLIPMGRMAKSDEYVSAIQFLCSNASAYMNGQNIVMDGGRSVL